MDNLTEREQKLLDIIKMLINLNTLDAIYNNYIQDMRMWKYNTLEKYGFSVQWQNETMEYLEKEFGLKYKKINKDGEPVEDGNQNQDGV